MNRHRPSVDVRCRSVANNNGATALGVIMTCFRDDSAANLPEMCKTLRPHYGPGQGACAVYGMPIKPIKRGGAEKTVLL